MPMKALLVIDMLNDFIKEDGALPTPGAEKLIPHINAKIREFHSNDWPVIFICDSHAEDDEEFEIWPKHCVVGTEGAEVVKGLDRDPEDIVVRKTRYSGFFNTDLEKVLKKNNIGALFLTGVLTDICVLHTAADAAMRGYEVKVPKDCVMALSDEAHEWALKHMKEVLNAKIL